MSKKVAEILKHSLYNLSYQTDTKEKKSTFTSVVNRTLSEQEAYLDLVDLHKLLIDSFSELNVI